MAFASSHNNNSTMDAWFLSKGLTSAIPNASIASGLASASRIHGRTVETNHVKTLRVLVNDAMCTFRP